MPKRKDLQSILVIGSGPIVIGQACEFDYSGTQSLKALREEGYRTILVNSNPATIMTDPEYSDATYIEPLTFHSLEKIIEIEKPDAILPTMGGQTALNLALELHKKGVLETYGVELIGARVESIEKAEDRERFKRVLDELKIGYPKSAIVNSWDKAKEAITEISLPVIIRPSFTLGGSGASFAYNMEEYEALTKRALELSPVGEVLVEESILGWKEFELEMMRDKNDNVIVVCSIENIDPVGVHTGDSITVAPQQSLSDREYQKMRDHSLEIMRAIGIDSGGSNIQYAVHPEDGTIYCIEMNPRVSRSSALASKATGYPIAKFAAKLAVGFTLDELTNDITRVSKASFEPSIDYVVTKIPRFDFEKFKQTDKKLGPQMKAVGEVMAIGRNFRESFQKALRSMEKDIYAFQDQRVSALSDQELLIKVSTQTPSRILSLAECFRRKIPVETIYEKTKIDWWFLYQMKQLIEAETEIFSTSYLDWSKQHWHECKSHGISDRRIAQCMGCSENEVRDQRHKMGVHPVYKMVDTCAAEFESYTNYLYSCYAQEDEAAPTDKKKVIVLGSGPNRIGQGVEFDYCCVHASQALRKNKIESIMVNCNPETVSTDYDISDRLYFEPLTEEDVYEIILREKPDGVILQFGGQTPLKLSKFLQRMNVKILGTSMDAIDMAEDRKRFSALLDSLDIRQSNSKTIISMEELDGVLRELRFPLMVRPSFVLGGRAMEIVRNPEDLRSYLDEAVKVSPEYPILIDEYLENSIEIDVDAVSDGTNCFVAGIMQHVEQAGVHSGDSSCVLPAFSLDEEVMQEIEVQTKKIAVALKVQGLMNIQYALRGKELYVLEVNPRASRTVPFVSKSIGIALVEETISVLLGKELDVERLTALKNKRQRFFSVKSPVFPFVKFTHEDTILGPEMKSTGEVMCVDPSWELAYGKAQIASGNLLPLEGKVFISVNDSDKPKIMTLVRGLQDIGFTVVSTHGTAQYLETQGLKVETVNKVIEGRPHIVDQITDQKIQLVINTTLGRQSIKDSYSIRRTALEKNIPYFTTVEGGLAAAVSIQKIQSEKGVSVVKLQDLSL
ncbi:MAG: carbamoyl-phosphate synthase large subunit [Bdellovibrionales bacterium]|nr:carbamoyl-phosphate synthase large subunit [Bdellovibrionales bacterium]